MSNKKSSLKEYFRKTYIDKANLIVLFIFVVLILISFFFFKDKFLGYKPIPNYNIPTISQNPEKLFPVETLDLRNTLWEYNTFSGSITNNGKKAVFNLKVRLAVSKTREKWDPEEQVVIIPYEIQSGKTILFSENVTSAGSSDPWWTSNVVDAKYYKGEKIPTPPPTPSLVPTSTPQSKTEWEKPTTNYGQVVKLDEKTSKAYFAPDDHMSTSDELFDAMNIYRKAHGLSTLQSDGVICTVAQNRLSEQIQLGYSDKHAGFSKYVQSQQEFNVMNEVLLTTSTPLTGTHIVEWAWDKSLTGHKEVISDPQWQYGCAATSNRFAVFVFGAR